MNGLSIAEIVGGAVFATVGFWLLTNAKRFPAIIQSFAESLPLGLEKILRPVPDPQRFPGLYVQNAYVGGVFFLLGGAYIVVSALLGWG